MLIRTDTLQPRQGEALEGVRHPSNIEALWNAQELLAIGLVKVIPMVIPEGFRAAGPPSYAAGGTETIPLTAIPPPTTEEVDAVKERTLNDELATLGFPVLLGHENRIRVLEGQHPISAPVFRAALRGLL